jgi:hypothetical protein
MAAFIHFSGCREARCIQINGALQRRFALNPEIPIAAISTMELWRSLVERDIGFVP